MHSWYIDCILPLLVVPGVLTRIEITGSPKWVLTELRLHYNGFAHPVIEATLENTSKGLEEQVWLSWIYFS